FIEKFGQEAELNEVMIKARCCHCRIKNNSESRIVLIGASTRQAAQGGFMHPLFNHCESFSKT
ncbi:MAG: hypothetical protein P8M25_21245, partial [Paracoccaceae bacterium]|nr:hypothetical protein [Paracoccaceae bacterium]